MPIEISPLRVRNDKTLFSCCHSIFAERNEDSDLIAIFASGQKQ